MMRAERNKGQVPRLMCQMLVIVVVTIMLAVKDGALATKLQQQVLARPPSPHLLPSPRPGFACGVLASGRAFSFVSLQVQR